MLKHISPVLRSSLVVAAVALLPLTSSGEGSGGWTTSAVTLPTGDGAAPLRSCVIPVGTTGTIKVYAGGADTSGNPLGLFPVTVTSTNDGNCPSTLGTCLRWDYKWDYTTAGFTPSASYPVPSFVSLDIDLNLGATLPTARVNGPGGDDPIDVGERIAEVRVVRFSANTAIFTGSLYTATNAQVGKVTAGYKGGDSRRGYCAIQGAQKPFNDPLLTKPQTITSTVGSCTITWSLSPDGCVTGAATSPSTCLVTNRDLVVNGQTATTASCGTEVAGPFGSTESCKWSSVLRQTICVTVP
jgi:hypothetical protein